MIEFENIFKSIDSDKDGVLNRQELLICMFCFNLAMHSLGYRNMTIEDIDKMIVEVDLNQNNVVEFSEFLKVNFQII